LENHNHITTALHKGLFYKIVGNVRKLSFIELIWYGGEEEREGGFKE
jgi:hypothetical protein